MLQRKGGVKEVVKLFGVAFDVVVDDDDVVVCTSRRQSKSQLFRNAKRSASPKWRTHVALGKAMSTYKNSQKVLFYYIYRLFLLGKREQKEINRTRKLRAE